MTLYHISEEPSIKVFDPRPIGKHSYELEGNAVWAIDKEHLVNYLFPRDCPRVTYFIDKHTSENDIKKFFGNTYARRIIAVETGWIKKILDHDLYMYEFDDSKFELVDRTAGYYISRESVVPVSDSKINNLQLLLLESSTEIRITPLLWKLREEVLHSTLGYSIIRMQNAQEPPEGISKYSALTK